MPRLDTAHYLESHHRLRKLWHKNHGLFADLTPVEQWMLHNFFRPDADLTDEQLIAYRKRVTAERPGLPQQAGKALAQFDQLATASDSTPKADRMPGPKSRRFTLKPIVHPEPDAKKVAHAFWMLAEYLNEQQGSSAKANSKSDLDDQPRSRP